MVWKPYPLTYLFPNAAPLHCTPSQAGTQVKGEEAGAPAEAAAYDYIVVGSGTAGSVIANRLSESEQASVLVLEHGHRLNDLISTIPLFSILRSNDARYSYKIKTKEQVGLGGKQVELLAGR